MNRNKDENNEKASIIRIVYQNIDNTSNNNTIAIVIRIIAILIQIIQIQIWIWILKLI